MNVEAVKRLTESFHLPDQTELIVDILLRNLGDAVVNKLVDKVVRDRMTDEEADRQHEDEQERLAEAVDRLADGED
jgi:hypothetical protein